MKKSILLIFVLALSLAADELYELQEKVQKAHKEVVCDKITKDGFNSVSASGICLDNPNLGLSKMEVISLGKYGFADKKQNNTPFNLTRRGKSLRDDLLDGRQRLFNPLTGVTAMSYNKTVGEQVTALYGSIDLTKEYAELDNKYGLKKDWTYIQNYFYNKVIYPEFNKITWLNTMASVIYYTLEDEEKKIFSEHYAVRMAILLNLMDVSISPIIYIVKSTQNQNNRIKAARAILDYKMRMEAFKDPLTRKIRNTLQDLIQDI